MFILKHMNVLALRLIRIHFKLFISLLLYFFLFPTLLDHLLQATHFKLFISPLLYVFFLLPTLTSPLLLYFFFCFFFYSLLYYITIYFSSLIYIFSPFPTNTHHTSPFFYSLLYYILSTLLHHLL